MKYKFYSAGIIIITFLIVAFVYFMFGNKQMPRQGEIEVQKAGEIYEMDEEILEFEHGDPS